MANETRQAEHDFAGDERLAAFFLGGLPVDEGEAVEMQLFTDPELAARAFAVEDELVNDYAHGGLSPAQRHAFEQNYLVTDERRERLEFARNLLQQWQSTSPVQPPAAVEVPQTPHRWRSFFNPWQLGYAVLLLVALLGWWRWTARQPTPPALVITFTPTPLSSPMPSTTPTATGSPGTTPVALPSPKPATSILASITLVGGTVRTGVPGQTTPTLTLSPVNTTVELKLVLLEHNHPNYRAVLQNQSGQSIWRAPTLKPQPSVANTDVPPAIVTHIPARLLTTGAYALLLTAKGPSSSEPIQVESYAFRVLRK